MLSRTQIKDIVFSIPILKKYYTKKRVANGSLIPLNEIHTVLDVAPNVYLEKPISLNLKVGLVKDGHEYEGFVKARAYYPKYERFLRNNNIAFAYYDIFAHDWQVKARDFDVVIWHTESDPSTQDIATNKIYVLEKLMGKKCLPSFDEIWSYEDKINAHYLYKHYNLPEIPTFVTHSKRDAIAYVNKVKFPIISKLATGSSSFGVVKLKDKNAAVRLINESFSFKGAKTYFPFQRQKNYLLFQEFIEDATFDLRIMVVGDKLFGYYRYPNAGDFKASGAGNYERKEIPSQALDLAFKVREKFQSVFLATDLLFSQKTQKYYIIESSIFIGIDTSAQLKLNNVPGYYRRISEGNYTFNKGKFWVQELALNELLKGK
ncbi:ATP-grasp domain-containing protein [Flavobacterium sp. JP2137]|uniref:ATP-grasp domain-containing protein n=1 Tax=Flavobacterium sp. JP2137 TaxID=3414510 RepID=UPI003D2FB710